LVTSLGGRVISVNGKNSEVPTLAILANDHRATCPGTLWSLRATYRIVRERWLDGVLAGEPLPDFKPHVVYARVGDVRDRGSYFYGAVAEADLVNRRDSDWKPTREDWTPAVEADDGST